MGKRREREGLGKREEEGGKRGRRQGQLQRREKKWEDGVEGEVKFWGAHEGQPLAFHPTNVEWRVRQCARLGLSGPLFLPERCPTQDLGVPSELNHIVGDGNCLYRAISLDLCGSQAQHIVVREKIIDIMCRNHQAFSAYVDGDVGDYLAHNTLRSRSWGSDVEIFAAATLLQTTIVVYTATSECSRRWLPHPPLFPINGVDRSEENIYLRNVCGHFERVVSTKVV